MPLARPGVPPGTPRAGWSCRTRACSRSAASITSVTLACSHCLNYEYTSATAGSQPAGTARRSHPHHVQDPVLGPAWMLLQPAARPRRRQQRLNQRPHLVLIAAGSEAYARALMGTNPGRLCAKSREMCHDRSREWPPVVRDVRDPDADRRHSATSCTQVRLGRRHLRRPCSGARLPKVDMSRGQPGGPRRRPPGRRAAMFESPSGRLDRTTLAI